MPRMKAGPKHLLLRLAMVAGLAGFAYFAIILLTPTFGRVVGYANEPPALEVTQPVANPSPPPVVREVCAIADLHFQARPQLQKVYWSQPSRIEERPDCWLITYATKVPIYQWLGLRQTLPPTDPAMYMSIEKSDLSMRWGKWCQ
jgi:hypothetical protein